MSRAFKRSIVLAAIFAFALAAPAQDQKNGTGVVPPGVKLLPQMPAAGAPKAFNFPSAATRTLANGLRVFVVTDHSQPSVAVRLVILSAGSIKDPAEMPGVAQMTANLLTQGTEKRSARDIAEAIDFIGGSLEASAGKDSTGVTLNVVKKDLSTGLDLMSDIVLHPAFRAEELGRQRQQLLSNLTVQYSDPEYLASVVFGRAVYGGSPYGWPEEGTPETVKKLDPGSLVKFHDANYAPNQSLLAFAGDITPEEAFAAAEKYFGAWPTLTVTVTVPPAPAPLQGVHIWLIDKPDAVQTQIRAGKLGIRRSDPDYVPVVVTNRIFGGGYNSRLNTEVRVKKGLTYDARSSFNPHRYAGSFGVETYTRTEATVEATKLVVDLIAQISTGAVTQQELDFARDYLAGVYPIQSETAEQVADRVLTVVAFDLPRDYNYTYPERIRGVTSAQVRDMAQKYLTASDLDLVLAGNVAAFRDALKKAFPDAKYEEIPFDQVDVLAPDLRQAKQAATPESLARGGEILLAAAKAVGGDALTSVTALQMTENGKLIGPGGETPGMDRNIKWLVSYPDRARGDLTAGGTSVVQICDGKSAWLQMGDQARDATPMMGEFQRAIWLFGGGWGLYQQVLAGKLAGQSIGDEEIDGKKLSGVAVQAPGGAIKLYFDPATHLLAAARYESAGPQGGSEEEQRWSDYRAVEGRQFAFSTAVYRNGVKYLESAIGQLSVNPKVDDALFAKPAGASPPSN
ncbi:MAG TPA: pitrilysin family protein [Candidatus Acidoferrales bacterium]|nr:pitrilysin family protein [Candidatus Acidoferrales bacterium]